jgi:restriction system protein
MAKNASVDWLDKVPKVDELLYPTIEALKMLGGSGTIEEIDEKVAEIKAISSEIQQVPHGDRGVSELRYRLYWARNYLKRFNGAVNSARGVWRLTEKGAGLTQDECFEIPALLHRQNYAARKKKQDEETAIEIDNETDTELNWKDLLLNVLKGMTADGFERLAQRILREAGFTKVEVTGKSGDGGIDGIGILKVNLVSFTILFQCKRYRSSVTPSVIRDFRGAMQGRCDKGLVITTGAFTAEAKKEATRDGAPAIDLIDGESLCDLLKELELGVAVERVERVSVDPEWFKTI